MIRTKIVCTIGPASRPPEILERLIRAGMNVARLNFSHGTHDEHGNVIRDVREIARRLDTSVAVLQDLAGPKIRTGSMAAGSVRLLEGSEFTLTTRPVDGNEREVSVTYKDLPGDVAPGDAIYLADGSLRLEVIEIDGADIRCKVIVGGSLSSHKGINLPGRTISAPNLTKKDEDDLRFGLEENVDYVALSFVLSADEIRNARRFMTGARGVAPIIAKIEKFEALDNLDAIIEEADVIMVARGDLGVEIPLEEVPRVQKRIIEMTNRAGKPVITATQMLKSMVDSPRPTRAEATDVANAILDGTDAVMLSEETTVGRYPVETVETMARIAAETERIFPFDAWASHYSASTALGTDEAVAYSACDMAKRIGAAAILTCTQSGSTTRLVAKYRPGRPIIALTPEEGTRRRLALVWGCLPLSMESGLSLEAIEKHATKLSLRTGMVKPGDHVVITAGLPLSEQGRTNLIKVSTAGS